MSSSVDGVAGSPRPAAWGEGAAVWAAWSPRAEGDAGVRSPGAVAWAPSDVPSEKDGDVMEGPSPVAEVMIMGPAGSGAWARAKGAPQGPLW